MADEVQSVIDIQGKSDGVDGATASVNKLADAMDGVSTASDTTSKATLSAEKSYATLQSRVDLVYRAQQQQTSQQKTLDAARAQGLVSDTRYSDLQDLIAQKYTNTVSRASGASSATTALSSAIDTGRNALLGYAAGIGPVGALLGSFGPWGVAAAAGIGLVSAAFNYVDQNADKFGDASIGIKRFGDVTGLTTTQVRGLTEAAEKSGISGEEIAGSFERFTANLDQARTGTGALYDALTKIDPQLAIDIASARSGADAWDLLAKATNSTTDATTKAALARAALGRGGLTDIPVLAATDNAGGLNAYSDELQKATGLTDQMTQHTAQMKAETDALNNQTAQIMASIYSEAVLERMQKAAQFQNQIAQSLATMAKGGSSPFPTGLPNEYGLPGGADGLPGSSSAASSPAVNANSGASAQGTQQIQAQATATGQLKEKVTELAAAQKAADTAADAFQDAEESDTRTLAEYDAALTKAGSTLVLLANAEKTHIATLGGAATGAEILQQRTDALTAAYQKGTISSQDYNRAVHGDTGNVVASLQQQIPVIQAIGNYAKINAQEQATINDLVAKGRSLEDATTIATQQRTNAIAAASAAAQVQTQAMTDQNALAALSVNLSGVALLQAQQSLAGEQAYNQVLQQTGSTQDALNRQVQVQLSYQIKIQEAKKQQQAADLSDQQTMLGMGAAAQALAASAQSAADSFDAMQKSITAAAVAAGDITGGMFTQAADSAFGGAPVQGSQANGVGTGDIFVSGGGSVYSAAQIAYWNESPEQKANEALSGVGSPYANGVTIPYGSGQPGTINSAISAAEAGQQGPISGAGSRDAIADGLQIQNPDDRYSVVQQLYTLLNSQTSDTGTQVTNDQQFMAWLDTQPETIGRDEAISTLQTSIDQLSTATTAATTATTDATAAITTLPTYLSSLYSSGQVTGFGLADGGVMTSAGAIMGTGGGVVSSPRTVTVGENYKPEAVIPLAGGAVPVTFNGGIPIMLSLANDNAPAASAPQPQPQPIYVNAPITIVASSDAGLNQAAGQAAQDFQNMMQGFASR